MLAQGVRRFVLPWSLPPEIDERELLFVPYLRFKGAVLYVSGTEFKHKLIDTTQLGMDQPGLPPSLGLRPQAMKVKPVVADMAGRFLEQTLDIKTVFSQAVKIALLFSKKKNSNLYHRAFIGESISKIYQPYYIHKEKIFDAVDNTSIGSSIYFETYEGKNFSSRKVWEPRFISTICPGCGGPLEGEQDSLALHCTNCETFWQELGGKFKPLQWSVVSSSAGTAKFLPFWKINFKTTVPVLESFGDFLRFTNQPVLVRKEHDSLDLCFWFPAFKINPKSFLQAARQLTLSQQRIPEGERGRINNPYPVTLPWKEAVQAIKGVLAETALNKRDVYPVLPKISINMSSYSLRYLPFTVHSHDLVQEQTGVTIVSAALKYGRKL